jgi:hypothetical protein
LYSVVTLLLLCAPAWGQTLPMPPVTQGFPPDTNTVIVEWNASKNVEAYYLWLIQWGAHRTNAYVISPLSTNLVVTNVTDADTWLAYIASVGTNGLISPTTNCVNPPLGITHIQFPADTNVLWSTDMKNWFPMTNGVNYWFTNLVGQTKGAPPACYFKPRLVVTVSSETNLP